MSAQAQSIDLTGDDGQRTVTRQFTYVIDAGARWDMAHVRALPASAWRGIDRDALNLGFSDDAVWLQSTLRNRADHRVTVVLSDTNAPSDEVDFYVLRSDGRVEHAQAGDRRPFSVRQVDDIHGGIRLELAVTEQVRVLLRVRSPGGALIVPVMLTPQAVYSEHVQWVQLLHGGMLGIMGILFIYNLVILFALRDRAYLLYVLYLPSAYFAQTALNGIGMQHYYPNTPWLANEGVFLAGAAAWLFILQFTREFLQTAQRMPRVDTALRVGLVVAASHAVVWLVLPMHLAQTWAGTVTLLLTTLCAGVGLVSLRHVPQQGLFYLAGQGASWVGMLVFMGAIGGALTFTATTFNAMAIGIVADCVMLSLGLAHRVRLLREDKLRAEAAHLALMQQRQEELEALVAERTRDLQAAKEEAERLSLTDALTGLANRRAFMLQARAEAQRANRTRAPLALLLLDLDWFKVVNDTHGHAVGDRLLQAVAQATRATARDGHDLAARTGGEEFCFLLPHTSLVEAQAVAKRLAEVVQAVQLEPLRSPPTFSAGLAMWRGFDASDANLDDWLQRADRALYRAKALGRNRTELDGEGSGPGL
ncbi:diguanylate cyclase [Curvibacter sp. APW13]|uniref:sensor domain-containing diguanylate cyclase n=1 Tax=Curvibacter sp. APW13 TaxID=3077236 RepID=UPI0028E06A7A|nr:diguanylate cyclase [Curvibacter sp. APW13]MDT8990278.1 diguanylate cyclase [Curvibacter sp. APW13]